MKHKFNEILNAPHGKAVCKSYGRWLVFVILIALIVVIIRGTNSRAGVLSLIFAATGLGERNITTWSGKSVAENLQNNLQRLFGILTLRFLRTSAHYTQAPFQISRVWLYGVGIVGSLPYE
jgi:hypothetical protein